MEEEVLEIAKFIHIADNQVDVYSMRMADIIIRCVVEIESISKELYVKLGGSMELKDKGGQKREVYFDTDCLALLEKNWGLSTKVINISSPMLYLEEEQNRVMCPLHKAHKRGGAKWNKAYQAIKHNRATSLKKYANIKNMLLAMGALYILNLYYKNESFVVQDRVAESSFDERVGSDLFSVLFADINSVSALDTYESYVNKGTKFKEAIYVKRYEKDSFEKIKHIMDKVNEIVFQTFSASAEGKQLLLSKITNKEPIPHSLWELIEEAGGKDLRQKINCVIQIEVNKLANAFKNGTYEYILNK